jgi:hypothetical protein
VTNDRVIERSLLGSLLIYLLVMQAVAAYLAYAPAAAPGVSLLRWPTCAIRHYLGIPCPLCFGTTTFILIWRGHWAAALRLDPFVFAIFWLSVVAIPTMAILIASRRPVSHWTARIPKAVWVTVAGTILLALVVNWFYLIITLSGVTPEQVLRASP